ncbi:MAG: PAS domain-containing protein [Candidatus Nomurabacteria bacterium]|nr:PAS domain-containing protein [Candidatus Nomurabacteria bacterium]
MQNEKEELYLRILDQFPNPIWRAGLDGKCDFFNKNWLKFTGRTMEQEMGNGWAEGVYPDELNKCVEDYMGFFNERNTFMLKYRLKHNDGTYHWLLDYGNPFFDDNGVFLGYIGSCYDVSELENSKILLDITGSMTKTGGWEINIESNKLHWTDEVYKIHEVEKDFSLSVENALKFYIGDSIKKITDAVNDAIKLGKPFDVELQLKTAKDNVIWVRALGQAIKENDKLVKVVGSFQNISDIKNAEVSLEEKNATLETMNKFMVGRELAMSELKNKITELEEKLNSQK